MKMDNIKFVVWAYKITQAMQSAKNATLFTKEESASKELFISNVCNIVREAIQKIKSEIEKLD